MNDIDGRICLRIPDDMAFQLKEQAKKEGKFTCEVARDAIREYLQIRAKKDNQSEKEENK